MKKKLLLITTMKDLLEKEMGEIQCNRQMCNYSGMDSSTGSCSFNGKQQKKLQLWKQRKRQTYRNI